MLGFCLPSGFRVLKAPLGRAFKPFPEIPGQPVCGGLALETQQPPMQSRSFPRAVARLGS